MGEEQCKLIEEDLKKMLFQSPRIKGMLPQEHKIKGMDSDFYSQESGEYSEEWPALGTNSSSPKIHIHSMKDKKPKGSKFTSHQGHAKDLNYSHLNKEPATSNSYHETANSAHWQRRDHHHEYQDTKYTDRDKIKSGRKSKESFGTDNEKCLVWENKSYGKKQFSNTTRKNKSTSRQLWLEEQPGNSRYSQQHAQHMTLNGNVDLPFENSDQYAFKSYSKCKERTHSREIGYISNNQSKSKGSQSFQDRKRDKKVGNSPVTQSSAHLEPLNSPVSGISHILQTEHSNNSKNNQPETSENKLSKNESFQSYVDDQENQELKNIKHKEKKKKKKKKDSKESKKKTDKDDVTSCTDSNLIKLDSVGEPHDKTSGIPTRPRINKATYDNDSQVNEIKEASISPERSGENEVANISLHIIESLLNDYVILKKSKPANSKKSHYYCQICFVSCPNVSGAQRHINTANHKAKKEIEDFEETLKCLPPPLPIQVDVVTQLLLRVYEEQGLSDRDVEQRQKVVCELNELIKVKLQGCSVELVGSSANGFGLKTSEVDIVLHVPSSVIPSDMLDAMFELLAKEEPYIEVTCEFKEKIPRIHFKEKLSMLKCNITLNSGSLCATAKLLNDYAIIDRRVRILGVCFRYWAKLCQLDQQQKGTLPSFCFPLLLIYFLQQHTPPVLPALHELAGNADGDSHMDPLKITEMWKCQNADSLGELWISLLRFYSVTFRCGVDVASIRQVKSVSCKDKNWGTKFLAIEDPYTRRNLAHSIPNHQLYRYVRDCFKQTYRYFGFPRLDSGALSFDDTRTKSQKNNIALESPVPDDEDRVGLKIVFTSDDESVSSTNLQDHLEDNDPDISLDSVTSGIARLSAVSSDSEDHETESLLVSSKTNFDGNKHETISSPLDDGNENKTCTLEADRITCQGNELKFSPSNDKTELKSVKEGEMQKFESSITDNSESIAALNVNNVCDQISKENTPAIYWKTNGITFTKDDICYYFLKEKMIGNVFPPVICRYCQKQGHLKQHCPDLKLPEIFPLPDMTPDFMKQIDKICEDIMCYNAPDPEEIADRDSFLLDLQEFIRHEFVEDAHLQMFGSCCNGFGFNNSDMDICLTFSTDKHGDKFKNHTALIESLAALLKKNRALHNVVPITSAKVPIVKFTFRGEENIEGDISLYNTLAQHNTRMLRTYCKIDRRVQILGYTMKYFAKVLDIGDASRGSLSSYAYILMVLFYLQQIDPPVIPVLQELYNGKMPERNIDGWNAWFYEDIDNLPNVWSYFNKNKQSIGELWLGLLCFYTEQFDFKEYVISIRQKEPLSRFKKLWNSKSIAIEDPFDLNHNLGSGLSRKMNLYIIKAFIRARQIFGTPIITPSPRYPNLQKYVFDKEVLSEGKNPPNDRGCRACGKIGHIVRDCPRRRTNRPIYQRDKDDHYHVRDVWTGGALWRDNQRGLSRQRRGRPQAKPTTPPRVCLAERHLHSQKHHNQGNEPVKTLTGKKTNITQGILPLPLNQVPGMSGGSIQSQNVPFFLHQSIQTANQLSQSLASSQRQPQLSSSHLSSFAGTAAVTRTTYSQSSNPNSQFSHQHLMQHQLPYGSQNLQQKSPYGLPQQQPHVSQSVQSQLGTQQQQNLHGGVQQQQSLLGGTQQQQQQSLLGPHPQHVQPSSHLLHQQLQHILQQQNLFHQSVAQKKQNHYQCMQQHAQENQRQPFSTVPHGILHEPSVSNFQRNQTGNNSYPTQSLSGVPFPREELVQNNSNIKGTIEEPMDVRGPMGFSHDDTFSKRS